MQKTSPMRYSDTLASNCALLVVDVEQDYILNRDMYRFIRDRQQQQLAQQKVEMKMKNLCALLRNLKDIDIYVTHENELYRDFVHVPHRKLPYWYAHEGVWNLPDALLTPLRKYVSVYVCGLWRERCVMHVAARLLHNGVHAVLFDHPDFMFEVALLQDKTDIEDIANRFGYHLKKMTA